MKLKKMFLFILIFVPVALSASSNNAADKDLKALSDRYEKPRPCDCEIAFNRACLDSIEEYEACGPVFCPLMFCTLLCGAGPHTNGSKYIAAFHQAPKHQTMSDASTQTSLKEIIKSRNQNKKNRKEK